MTDDSPTRSGLEGALRAPVRAVLDRPSRALTSAVAERVAEILIDEGVVERVVDKALSDPGVERAALQVVDSDLVDAVTERLLASDEIQQIIERIAKSPEVRSAVAYQGFSLLDELRRELGKVARRADGAIERPLRWLARKGRRHIDFPFAGAVTRSLALAIDAWIVNLALLGLSALIALVASAFEVEGPGTAEAVIAGSAAWFIAAVAYLTFFWTLTGQTPGMRFMGIAVQRPDGSRLSLRRAFRRLIGMLVGALAFLFGFLEVLLNDRRRGWHDAFADSIVVYRERP